MDLHTPDDVIAIATAGLALVTLFLVIATLLLFAATRQMAREAREDADKALDATKEATKRQLAAGRRQLEMSYQPLLIEVLPKGPVAPDMGAQLDARTSSAAPQIDLHFPDRASESIDPRAVCVRLENGSAYVSIPLRNVGRGLAIIEERGLILEGAAIGAPRFASVRRTRVPVLETSRVDLVSDLKRGHQITKRDSWIVSVPYHDFAAGQQTTARVTINCQSSAAGTWLVTRVDQA